VAVSINFYNKFIEYIGDGTIDLDNDTFTVILMNGSHTFNATHTQRTDIAANQLSTANGYTQDAKNLGSVTWTESGGTVTFDAADVTWTASGGDIGPAAHAVIYSDTAAGDELMCSIDFDGSQTAGDGTDFKITFHASGIFTISST
jgi:hypothetical protein